MRTIKFRGKKIYDDGWAYGLLSDIDERDEIAELGMKFGVEYVHLNTVGQFTGLHDKNGKEIYEDDILLNRHNRRYKVSWSDEEQRRILVNLLNADDYLNMYKNCMDDFEVIGNIHDNPELLQILEIDKKAIANFQIYEQIKKFLEKDIKSVNKYIEKHPKNLYMIKYLCGRISVCDDVLGTDSRSKINMGFATLDEK